jgi:hypothetical protein
MVNQLKQINSLLKEPSNSLNQWQFIRTSVNTISEVFSNISKLLERSSNTESCGTNWWGVCALCSKLVSVKRGDCYLGQQPCSSNHQSSRKIIFEIFVPGDENNFCQRITTCSIRVPISELTSTKTALMVASDTYDKVALSLQQAFAEVEDHFYSDFLVWQTFGGHMKVCTQLAWTYPNRMFTGCVKHTTSRRTTQIPRQLHGRHHFSVRISPHFTVRCHCDIVDITKIKNLLTIFKL